MPFSLPNEPQFRGLLEAAPDAIVISDSTGAIVLVNAQVERLFGYSREELLGQPLEILVPERFRQKHTEDRSVYAAHPRIRTMNTGLDLYARRKNGEEIPVDISLSPMKSEEGLLFIASIRDITERKRAEELLRRKDEELLQSRKLEAIGRLAGGIAHDFNNLLTGISACAEELASTIGPDDPRRAEVKDIQELTERAMTLTRQLLTFGRRQSISPQVVQLNELLSGLAATLKRLIRDDIQMILRLDPAVAAIRADSSQLEQIVVNLAVNARDAMPRGGKLTLQTGNRRLDPAEAAGLDVAPGDFAWLSITDTGEGMAPEVRSKIFEPFYTTKETGKGSGLGLAIVYGIVKQSNGGITVSSQPGLGTTFKIYFPAIPVDAGD